MGKNIIGFDFGESRIKMVVYDGGKVKKALITEVPDNMMAEGAILSMDAMADLIRDTMKENGIGKGAVAVILSSESVYTRTTSMPVMSHQQVLYNLPYEFSDYLTQEKGSYYFDYMVLGTEEDEEGKVTGMRIFACAVLKSVINNYKAMFKRAGLKLKMAVPVEYAYSRLIGHYLEQNKITEKEDCCIVDVGHAETRVFMFHGSEHVQRRNCEFGLRGLNRIISEQLSVDEHVAHTYKDTNYNGVLDQEYSLEYFDQLAVEVMKTINFFNYNNREAELKRIYMTGGGSAIPQIAKRINELTGLTVELADDFLPEAGNLEHKELFAAACGSTM